MAIGIVLIFTAIMFAQFNPFRKKSKAGGSGIDLENIEILEEKEDPSLKNDNEEDSDDK